MSFWLIIKDKLKEILQKMIGIKTIEQELHVVPAVSTEMEKAIQLWSDMYKNRAPWLHEPASDNPVRVVSLGLPALIASEKARMVLLEFESEITTPVKEVEKPNPDYPGKPNVAFDQFGNEIQMPYSVPPETLIEEVPITSTARAEFLESQYKKLKKELHRQLEFAIAKGGLVIKPYVVFNKAGQEDEYGKAAIEFDFVQADCFYPLAFDASGNITEAAFLDSYLERNVVYRRLEYHKWTGNEVKIVNKAFKSMTNSSTSCLSEVELGKEVPLSQVSQWADLEPSTTIKNVSKPLFAYFRMPEANTVDLTSPLGVSGFARAVENIRDADMQYSRLLWEYEAGEMAIDIDRDALRLEDAPDGQMQHTHRPYLQERLMRKVDLGSQGDTYNPFTPTLRDSSYIQGLNTILMRIEDICGISRGTLSDAATEARTATELKILKQRSFQTIRSIQNALEETLRDVIYIMDVYCTLYNVVGDVSLINGVPQDGRKGQWDVSFEWDDSILVDVNEELNKRLTLMQNGICSKLELRRWYFGETERQAREALEQVQQESQESMEENLMMESSLVSQSAAVKASQKN
jgi:A118 family predicted phage portal protein